MTSTEQLETPTARRSVRISGISRIPQGIVLPLALVALVVALAFFEPRFFSAANLANIARNASYLAIVGTAQMLVIMLGGLDLSIGVTVALSSVVTAITMSHGLAWWPENEVLTILFATTSALGAAALVGLLNGMCIARLNASAFMVTLGMFSVVGGIAFYLTAGIPIYGLVPEFIQGLGRGTVAGVPVAVLIAIAVVLTAYLVQNHTRFGRHLYAIGGNAHAARVSGVPTQLYTVIAYIVCSLLAGVAGILITARIGAGQANLGSEYMLQSIGAAVIAGVSLRGGVGRVESLLLSSIFLTVFANAMNLSRIDSKIQTIVFGVVLLSAVMLDRTKRGGGSND
ncbi:ABC transporter permease [Bradyrhizobium sp. BR13661]|uniref:ABC transporter permease n=1 Tax=Bradyrhizobium sp. BR13661 TaxID=2940622 RepID=UPI00247701D4|nr:ABC transporter permease [Bradyrhizobium sp. BR13661]MDH6261780.1 ribose transport system permease protein [Bradyrhizobium sp. BR13661]